MPTVAETIDTEGRAAKRRPVPHALLWGVGVCVALTLLSWSFARLHFASQRARLLFIGDSVIANYRIAPGERVEDILQQRLVSAWSVRNFAECGSRIGDYYPLLAKAELLGFKPDVVVVELNPAKLVEELDVGPELDEDGRELMWLPLDSEGARYFQTLSPHYRDIAPVRKISLLFGFFEGFRAAWHHDVNWPMKRRAMLAEGREARRARIRQHAIDMGMRWSQKVDLPSYEHFRGSEKVRALEFLLEALQRRNAQALMLLPPWPNQGLVDVAFSPRGRQALTLIREHTLRYARERKVRVLALDDPEVLQKLGPFDWDDLEHLSTQRSSALIADAIAGALPAAASKP